MRGDLRSLNIISHDIAYLFCASFVFWMAVELKLMDIETEQLGIPETPYQCTVQMNADEFQRIVRDLQVLGDTCTISCGKEGIRFSVSGAIGNGNILIRSNDEENQKDRAKAIKKYIY